jgi:hypothetical protein
MEKDKTLMQFMSPDNQNLIRSDLLMNIKEYTGLAEVARTIKITQLTLKKFIMHGNDVDWTTLAKIERFLIVRAKKDNK